MLIADGREMTGEAAAMLTALKEFTLQAQIEVLATASLDGRFNPGHADVFGPSARASKRRLTTYNTPQEVIDAGERLGLRVAEKRGRVRFYV